MEFKHGFLNIRMKRFLSKHIGHIPEPHKFIIYNAGSIIINSIQNTISYDSMLKTCWSSEWNSSISSQILIKDAVSQCAVLGILAKITTIIDHKSIPILKTAIVVENVALVIECALPILGINNMTSWVAVNTSTSIVKCVALSSYASITSKIVRNMNNNPTSDSEDKTGEYYMKLFMMSTACNSVGLLIGCTVNICIPCEYTRLYICIALSPLRYVLYTSAIKSAGIN